MMARREKGYVCEQDDPKGSTLPATVRLALLSGLIWGWLLIAMGQTAIAGAGSDASPAMLSFSWQIDVYKRQAQVFGIDLSIGQQLTIVMTAVLASIGTAGVPGSGMIMLAMVLQSVGLPVEGVALVAGVDRILDMMRTTVNVTGDAAVATCVDAMQKRAAARKARKAEKAAA